MTTPHSSDTPRSTPIQRSIASATKLLLHGLASYVFVFLPMTWVLGFVEVTAYRWGSFSQSGFHEWTLGWAGILATRYAIGAIPTVVLVDLAGYAFERWGWKPLRLRWAIVVATPVALMAGVVVANSVIALTDGGGGGLGYPAAGALMSFVLPLSFLLSAGTLGWLIGFGFTKAHASSASAVG